MLHYLKNLSGTVFLIVLLLFSFSCKKKTLPLVTTANVTEITSTTAVSGGNVTDDGNAAVTARGVCWGTAQNPTTESNKTTDGTGVGTFTSNLTGLTVNTTYYVRAYATNSEGTAYGNELSFTTQCQEASATTNAASGVGNTNATLNGTVNANGSSTTVTFEYGLTTSYGSTVTATPSPVSGSGNTTVSASISGLTPGTTYHFRVKAVNCGGTVNGSDQTFTTTAPKSILQHIGINKTNINLTSETVVGQITINPTASGKVIVTFDGHCYSSPGDRIILAASNTTSWGVNDGSVSVEAYDNDVNHNSFSHTRVYDVSPGSHTYYAVAHNYVETAGTHIASIYGSLTVKFIPSASNLLVGYTPIMRENVNLASTTTLGTVTINPTVSGKAIVKFDGKCVSSPGDRIVIAASNSTSYGINDGNVGLEAVNTDVDRRSFSHTRVYDVSPGSRTFYALAHNAVELDGDGIASIYGSLTVLFIPSAGSSIASFTGIDRSAVNLSSSTVLGQLTINPTVSGKVLVRFNGQCISTVGDQILLAASNSTSWSINDGNIGVEAISADLNTNPFSHTRVYTVSPGSRTFYAIGHNYVETDGTGIAYVYGSLVVEFFPD